MFRPSAFSVIAAFFVSANLPGSPTPATRATGAPVDQIITWLLDEDRQLREIPFAEVIFDATGKRVLPMDSKNEIVGLELIGVREFSIGLLRKIAPIDTSKIDFEKARFVHAAKRDPAEA